MIHIITKNKLIILFFVSFFYSILSKIFNFTGIADNLKYILFFINILFDFVYIRYHKVNLKIKVEYRYMVILVLLMMVGSIIISLLNNSMLSYRTIVELIYILLPATSAFCIVNIFTKEEIIYYMKWLLFFSLCTYFIEILSYNLSLSDLLKISFVNSYSPFESYIFADVSIFCFCFFSYFRDSKIEDKQFKISENVCYYISFIFVLMTFKRILVLFSICLFVFNYFKMHKKIVPKKVILLIVIFFTIITMIYTWLLQGENSKILMDLLSINLDKFTVGRKWYFSIVEANRHLLNGYGSTTNILTNILGPGKYLEMDLVKIYIEMGPIILATFIYVYWKQIYNNVFSVIICFFLFINMLFSHSLTTFYAWILFFILFYTIKIDCQKESE